jgi:Lysine methyltransferase
MFTWEIIVAVNHIVTDHKSISAARMHFYKYIHFDQFLAVLSEKVIASLLCSYFFNIYLSLCVAEHSGWDSGVVLAKFLEHTVDIGQLSLKGTRVVELGAGCGFAGYKFLTFLYSYLLWFSIQEQSKFQNNIIVKIRKLKYSSVSDGESLLSRSNVIFPVKNILIDVALQYVLAINIPLKNLDNLNANWPHKELAVPAELVLSTCYWQGLLLIIEL